MTLQDAQHGDVFLVLPITPEEAQYGSIRSFVLPNGRSVLVTIPANTRAHDEIRLPGQDLSTNDYPISKDLVLQIALSSTTESVAPADTASSAEQTLLLATAQAGEFPLILPATPASFEQSAFQQDSLTSSESAALYDAASASPPVDFQALPLTPVDLVALPLTPVPDEATISASLLSADLAPAPSVSDEATVSISEPPADLDPAISDEATVSISDVPTDHVPAATLAQAETLTVPASSEIVATDEVDPATAAASDTPASSAANEIIVLDDAAPASPLAFPTAEPYIFTAPPQILPFQPKRRKRPDR